MKIIRILLDTDRGFIYDSLACFQTVRVRYLRAPRSDGSPNDIQKKGDFNMANIKSAKKRILVAQTRNERNKAIRSEVKTYIKRVYAAVEAGDKAAAQDALKMAQKKICMAHSKGVYKSNNASRKVAHISKAVSSMN